MLKRPGDQIPQPRKPNGQNSDGQEPKRHQRDLTTSQNTTGPRPGVLNQRSATAGNLQTQTGIRRNVAVPNCPGSFHTSSRNDNHGVTPTFATPENSLPPPAATRISFGSDEVVRPGGVIARPSRAFQVARDDASKASQQPSIPDSESKYHESRLGVVCPLEDGHIHGDKSTFSSDPVLQTCSRECANKGSQVQGQTINVDSPRVFSSRVVAGPTARPAQFISMVIPFDRSWSLPAERTGPLPEFLVDPRMSLADEPTARLQQAVLVCDLAALFRGYDPVEILLRVGIHEKTGKGGNVTDDDHHYTFSLRTAEMKERMVFVTCHAYVDRGRGGRLTYATDTGEVPETVISNGRRLWQESGQIILKGNSLPKREKWDRLRKDQVEASRYFKAEDDMLSQKEALKSKRKSYNEHDTRLPTIYQAREWRGLNSGFEDDSKELGWTGVGRKKS